MACPACILECTDEVGTLAIRTAKSMGSGWLAAVEESSFHMSHGSWGLCKDACRDREVADGFHCGTHQRSVPGLSSETYGSKKVASASKVRK